MCKFHNDTAFGALPDYIANQYGITNLCKITNTENSELVEYSIKILKNSSSEVFLSDLNDVGMSFIEIADVIEKHFETIN